ncbi:MAG: hypothetical protein EOO38_25750, partial [Cytophagaceae bacterium]
MSRAKISASLLICTALSLGMHSAIADNGNNDHNKPHENSSENQKGHRLSVTVSFGAGLNTAQPGNSANHHILPPLIIRNCKSQHQAVKGRAGPPRIAFPNPTIVSPVDDFGRRVSYGCLQGPFRTGVLTNGSKSSLVVVVLALSATNVIFALAD